MMPVFLVALCGCASGLQRTGYTQPKIQNAASTEQCRIAIRAGAQYDLSNVEILGRIRAYESGLSVDCDEAYILDLFCREACALGADLVNITQEQQPYWRSTCYQARAELIRYKDRKQANELVSDAKFAPQLVIDRSEKSKKRTRQVISAAVFGGALGGIIVSTITSPR